MFSFNVDFVSLFKIFYQESSGECWRIWDVGLPPGLSADEDFIEVSVERKVMDAHLNSRQATR